MRTLLLTATALIAFAANSWLCRAALRDGAIDAAGFTAMRLAAGAAVLALVARRRSSSAPSSSGGDWLSAAALFVYAIAFSFAYLALDSGVGALVLFAAVQLTMLGGGVRAGHRPRALESGGVLLALAGLAWFALPGADAPPPLAAAGMAAAGVAWGIYSLLGRGASRPLAANAGNFVRTLPAAALALALWAAGEGLFATPRGLALAAFSGGVTSGLGYAVWYAALGGLTPLLAGLVQLLVPILAAVGGVVLLGETLTPRLFAAGAVVLAGIALALVERVRGGVSPRRP